MSSCRICINLKNNLIDSRFKIGVIINKDMKILVLLTLIFSTFSTVFAEDHKKYKEEEFDKIKHKKMNI